MKRFILAFILILPSIAYANPVIVFESERYDFGAVKEGEVLEHTFEFANTGSSDLVIQSVSPS